MNKEPMIKFMNPPEKLWKDDFYKMVDRQNKLYTAGDIALLFVGVVGTGAISVTTLFIFMGWL